MEIISIVDCNVYGIRFFRGIYIYGYSTRLIKVCFTGAKETAASPKAKNQCAGGKRKTIH